MDVHSHEEHGDEALAAAFAAHDPWAFGEAYRRNASLLYSVAHNVLSNPEDAKDCVADALARLWRSSRPYSAARGNLRNFLVVCVRNEAISRRRRHVRRTRVEERLAGMALDRDEHATNDPIERDVVRRAIFALPPEQRMPIALAYYSGKTHTEIAAELHEPLGTIKSRIKLGLRKLAASLQSLAERGSEPR
ncbi:MAG TPA: sigma-70 family RNA polymerase sigma factor [Candidatus Cybelea sp.]|jgi:RNA polymerase sigma-70 factor (ECF subfamily)|nr:sigma-70 family RNA polymerase sigma factor [Candidatus Cybelea sp.]